MAVRDSRIGYTSTSIHRLPSRVVLLSSLLIVVDLTTVLRLDLCSWFIHWKADAKAHLSRHGPAWKNLPNFIHWHAGCHHLNSDNSLFLCYFQSLYSTFFRHLLSLFTLLWPFATELHPWKGAFGEPSCSHFAVTLQSLCSHSHLQTLFSLFPTLVSPLEWLLSTVWALQRENSVTSHHLQKLCSCFAVFILSHFVM
jgi:hypothetical protein